MKKVILNKCFGGFGLSAKAYKLYCEKRGLECHFYKTIGYTTYKKIDFDSACKEPYTNCFTKNLGKSFVYRDGVKKYRLYFDRYNYKSREDSTWIEVIEDLGEDANTWASNLVVVEIPDNLDYEIDTYDGFETLHEKVRVW